MAQNDNIGNDLSLRTVLICRLGAMGDVAMTIPVIYSACHCYDNITFVMVTRKSIEDLFTEKPRNLVVVGCDMHRKYSGILGRYNLAKEMHRKYHPDAFIDLQNNQITKIMQIYFKLHGVTTIKFNREIEHKKALTRRANKVMLPMPSSRARYRQAFFACGLPIEENFDGLYGHNRKGSPELFRLIAQRSNDKERWVGIAPFAAYPQKEYPAEKMEIVIGMFAELPEHRVFIFGGDGREQEIASEWAEKFPHVTSLAGKKYGFPVELALLSHIDVMITMDSANMHLASIVGTPTISVWGATHHYCGFKGWKQSENDMVQIPLSCRPCSINGDKPCYRHDMLCLSAIRPESIFVKATEKLRNSQLDTRRQ